MCSLDTMEQSLRMGKRQVEKPTPWRELLTTQICRVSYPGIYNVIEIMNSSSLSLFSPGLSTTSSIISIQWKRTLSSTSRCPTLRSTWTNAGISLTVSRDKFAAQRNNLGFLQLPRSTWPSMKTRITKVYDIIEIHHLISCFCSLRKGGYGAFCLEP